MAVALSRIVQQLDAFWPLRFAEAWDNVGLLLEPAGDPAIERILLTIDLSEQVLEEAEASRADLVLAYHPPLFKGLKRLRASVPSEHVIWRCIQAGRAVFSPHTAFDAAPGGLNDWLTEAFGPGRRQPALPHTLDPRFGAGRVLELEQPVSLAEAVGSVKRHLGMERVRVAESARHAAGALVRRIAVAAGSGGAVFETLRELDLYVTGELRHHDILALVAAGGSVICCDHTNTERGFLPVVAARLAEVFGSEVSILVSSCDRDPLTLV